MDSSAVVSLRGGRAPGVLDAVAGERENCLKEIANNYVEEEEEEEEEDEDEEEEEEDDVENNSSSEVEEEDDNNNNNNNNNNDNNRGDLRENGMQHGRRLGMGGEMHSEMHSEMQNGRFDGGALGVGGSVQSSGEEEEEEEIEEEGEQEEGGQEQEQEQEHEQEDDEGSVHSRRDTDMEENGFVNTNNNSRKGGSVESGEHENKHDPAMGEDEGRAANEKAESADECTVATTNALARGQHDEFEEMPEEKSLTESEGAPLLQVVENGGGGVGVLLLPGPTLRRRRGRPLKSNGRKTSSIRAAPITPKLEEPRAVRSNRGIKRRFPGDESEDSLPKRVRVRSIASVCGDFVQPIKGEDLSMEEGLETTPARRRGRPRKSERIQGLKDEDPDTPTGPTVGKRKMVEAVLESDSMKHPCHGRAGPIFACNAEGCKKRFVEAAQLYTHARVHGDRPYVCHYDGCVKSFSERSKLKRHFLIHTGEKPFLCHYEGCGKAFSLDFNLRSHMKTHTGDYHECPYDGCEKRYCQEYKLRAHIGKEHNKPVRGTKKMAKIGGNDMRGAIEAAAATAAAVLDSQKEAAKRKRERLAALQTKRSRLEMMKEGKVSRLSELEQEKQREASELAHIEHDLKKLEWEQRQLEDGGDVSSPVISLSLSEDDEEEEEEEEEEESEENDDDKEGGEDMAPSHGMVVAAAGDTSSSGEQQSRLLSSPLEYTAMGEGRDVVMFAHKLPTADQGARLMKNVETRPTVDSSPHHHQEPTTSLTPLLWLQGVPPHSGHLAGIPALRPFLRSRRPGPPPPPGVVSDTGKQIKSSPVTNNTSSLGVKEKNNSQPKRSNGELWSQGESSDSGLGKSKGGVGKANKQHHHHHQEGAGSGKLKGGSNNNPVKNSVGAAGGKGSGRQLNVSNVVREKSLSNTNTDNELNGKLDHHRPQNQREREPLTTAKVSKPQQQGGRQFSSSSDQVFVSMNPILLSTDHGFSPTDARFLAANEGFSTFSAQGLLRDRLQLKEGVKTASCGGAHQPAFAPKEKAYRSMNEVLHSTAEQGLSACSALNDTGFVVAEQAPSEQSFEPSAAQLFTYHEQPRLVD